ncbi:class IIb bacteriocin, lactobin A/cerein 7B family [Streptococcus pantholopis]|nr:class IIb bacteriocin, lactobin A/cerein 7B family [Streptococcus pantholopis]
MKNDMTRKIDNVVKFEELTSEELQQISGGIAPILIGVGVAASLGGGFAAGYTLARVFG